MPVDCRFQTYPWKDSSNPKYQEYNGTDGNCRLNYLLHLEMTANEDGTVPKIDQDRRFLKEVGNWTDGTKPGIEPMCKFGSFVLTERKFLDGYLLPKFDKMNRMVKVDLSNLEPTSGPTASSPTSRAAAT
jgi:hypothetical protein